MDRSRLIMSATIALTMLIGVLLFNSFRSEDASAPGREGTFSISGRVAAGEGQARDGIWIRVTGQHEGRVRSVTVPLAPDGSFTAPALEPAYYTLRALRRVANDGERELEVGSAATMVTDADVTGMVIEIKR